MHYVLNDNAFCEPAFLLGVLFEGGISQPYASIKPFIHLAVFSHETEPQFTFGFEV